MTDTDNSKSSAISYHSDIRLSEKWFTSKRKRTYPLTGYFFLIQDLGKIVFVDLELIGVGRFRWHS